MDETNPTQELHAALVKFQAAVENPKNSAVNPHFRNRYAPLSDVLNGVRPLLAKQGLAVVQEIVTEEDRIGVQTIIVHRAGASMACGHCVLRPTKADPQQAGSALTYARRYSLSAALGIASEDDDDGNRSSEPATERARPKPKITDAEVGGTKDAMHQCVNRDQLVKLGRKVHAWRDDGRLGEDAAEELRAVYKMNLERLSNPDSVPTGGT